MRALLYTIIGLLILTALSYIASRFHLGAVEIPVALGIAVAKALLVAWIFMELPHSSLPAKTVALVTLSFIALLCAGTVADIGLR